MNQTAAALLREAEEALRTGDLDAAAAAYESALAERMSPEAACGRATVAFLHDDFAAARRHWELAHKLYRDAGDFRGAARVAAELAAFFHDALGNGAASQGWIARSRRLLGQVGGRCVEQGYLALALVACDIREAHALERSAALALDLAMEFGDRDLESRALADGGLALVNQGRISQGFARLDEAMAAVSAGHVSPAVCGKIFCAMLSACERVGDLRRAEEWTRACEAYLDSNCKGRFPILQSHCRTAYGSILCDIGRWNEGEREILRSLGPASSAAVVSRAQAVSALAGLRLMQGRLEEAAELLEPYADRLEVCEKLARLHAMRKEPDLAVSVIMRGLDSLAGDTMRAGPLLEILVEAELARGNVGQAERALARLTEAADASEGTVLRAMAKRAQARIASHHERWAEAVEALADAAAALAGDERPLLEGRIRRELADALARTGDGGSAIAEARGALAIFERVGAVRDADEVAALLRSLGSTGRSRARSRDAASSLTARERDVFALLGEGLTNAEIAARLFITPKTAEHHVSRVLNKLGVRSRTEAAALAAASRT